MSKKYQIPFDAKGNQLHQHQYPFHEFRDNYIFEANLKFVRLATSWNGHKHAIFTDGKVEYTMLLGNFEEYINLMSFGNLKGKFTFVKKGNAFGLKMLNNEPPTP